MTQQNKYKRRVLFFMVLNFEKTEILNQLLYNINL